VLCLLNMVGVNEGLRLAGSRSKRAVYRKGKSSMQDAVQIGKKAVQLLFECCCKNGSIEWKVSATSNLTAKIGSYIPTMESPVP
jgi:predicted homoserine dehydrogenase-like protein